MRVLIIKTSSLGDIIHTLPALTDAGKNNPAIQFDWVVEEKFAEIPTWHLLVKNVIPVALRRWRKNPFSKETIAEFQAFRKKMHENNYDYIIDAQGLLKSVWLMFLAKGVRCGMDWHSAREPLASLFYQKKFSAGKIKESHAVARTRQLFSQVLNYPNPTDAPDYGLLKKSVTNIEHPGKYLVFLHGTTWDTKLWPENSWIELAKIAAKHQFDIKLLWGNETEFERARRIAKSNENIQVLPRLNLAEIANILSHAKGVVSVDTGLGHLAAALDIPAVSLYGPTFPELTGTVGRHQKHLSANNNQSLNLGAISAPDVWAALAELL